MSENSVTTTFFADEKAAAAAIAKLEKHFEDLEHKIKHMHKEHNHGSHEALEKMGEMVKGAAGMALGFAGVEAGIEKAFEAMKEFRKEADAAAVSIDKANRKFAVRTGESGETLKRVREQSSQAGTSHETGEALFGDLKNRGFKGGAEGLAGFTNTAAAYKVTNDANGVSTAEFADAMAKSMDRMAPKTAEAEAKAARDVSNMTRGGSEMTASDVGSLGETFETSKAGRHGMQNPKHQQALNKLGLKFEDIDLVGEDFATAMKRVKGGLDKIKPEERMATLQLLTGDAGMARRVMSGIDHMEANDKRFGKDVKTATGGLAVAEQRAKDRMHETNAAAGGDFGAQVDAADQLTRDKGAAGWMSGMRRGYAQTLKAVGVSDEGALKASFGSAGSGSLAVPENFMQELNEQTKILKEGLDLQKEANEQREKGNEQARGKPKRGKGAEN